MMAKALLANAPIREINKSSFGIVTAKPATEGTNLSTVNGNSQAASNVPVIITMIVRKIQSFKYSYFIPIHDVSGGSKKSIGT